MNTSFKKYLNQVLQAAVFYAIALVLWCLFRFYGIGQMGGIIVQQEYQQVMQVSNLLRLFFLSGILVGILFATIGYVFDKFTSKRLSLGLVLFLKTGLYLLTLIVISTLAKLAINYRFGIQINARETWYQDQTFLVTLLYVLLVSVVFQFLKIASDKFGKGVFLKMLLGKYKKPQEEKRIFMFLDLKSSTTIAEQLGHFKYSQLIQDCFYDLNAIVPKYSAEIYQYVGDEAVLSWPYAKGLANNNCVKMYFEFASALKQKQAYYLEKYNTVPVFKAGLHGGKLMVAEVGVVKKELAFHGDVINTSARIQSQCNTYNVSILISELLKDELPPLAQFSHTHMGNVLLKGKEHKLNIYAVESA